MSNWTESPESVQSRVYLGISAFLIGFLGSYYVQMHYYAYFSYSSMCIGSIHWHHLYTGAIIIFLSALAMVFTRKRSLRVYNWLYFLLCFGVGMLIDDITDHWLFVFDPFEFYCTR